jgi:hypothetical protein
MGQSCGVSQHCIDNTESRLLNARPPQSRFVLETPRVRKWRVRSAMMRSRIDAQRGDARM